jgi:prepilin-type N-terminal cleavage/methylation domain-containing protein
MDQPKVSRAFTLVELMIVITILGILTSIVIPKFASMVRKAKEARTLGGLGALRSALSIYVSDMEGEYPRDIASFTVNGKYITALPPVSIPPYHDEVTGIMTDGTQVMGVIFCNPPCDIKSNIAVAGEPLVFWAYVSPFIGAVVAVPVPDSDDIGMLWISCSHTDSKGTLWTMY